MDAEQQDWEPCPAGQLTKMVESRRALRRRKIIDRVAVAAACVMAFIAVAGYTLGLFTPDGGLHEPTAIACNDVLKNLPAYLSGELDEPTTTRIAAHLDHCPSCRTRHDELAQSVSRAAQQSILFALAWR